MNKVALKLGKVLKNIGIILLVVVSVVTWTKAGTSQLKIKSLITCEPDSGDTIILGQERCRVRVFLDVLKKLPLFSVSIRSFAVDFPEIEIIDSDAVFVSFYQRNIFYIHAPSTVP